MNGKHKIGRRELEIIQHLQGTNGVERATTLIVYYSPQVRKPGDRNLYSQYNVVETRLRKMVEKGLIIIEKDGPDRIVKLAV